MKPQLARNVPLVLLVSLGIGALFGGTTLIISPSGKLIGMPLEILSHSHFADFLMPGIILFLLLGVVPVLLTFALALIIWIQLEMAFLQAAHWLHTFYMMYALAIIAVLVLPSVRSEYKKQS